MLSELSMNTIPNIMGISHRARVGDNYFLYVPINMITVNWCMLALYQILC